MTSDAGAQVACSIPSLTADPAHRLPRRNVAFAPIVVSGLGFLPDESVDIRECNASTATFAQCSDLAYAQADANGALSATVYLDGMNGPASCYDPDPGCSLNAGDIFLVNEGIPSVRAEAPIDFIPYPTVNSVAASTTELNTLVVTGTNLDGFDWLGWVVGECGYFAGRPDLQGIPGYMNYANVHTNEWTSTRISVTFTPNGGYFGCGDSEAKSIRFGDEIEAPLEMDLSFAFPPHLDEAPSITSPGSTSVGVHASLGFVVTTTGYPAPQITESGALPTGVTLLDDGDGTAQLLGTPAPGTVGVYPITISASNRAGTPATQQFTLTVTATNSAPGFTSALSDSETFGVPFRFQLTTVGFPLPKLTKTGTLPAGVTFVDNKDGTATISGTPSNAANGTYTFTVTAKSSLGTDSEPFTLTILRAPTLKKIPNATATVGTPISLTFTTTGGSPDWYDYTGAPADLTGTYTGGSTATLIGTPGPGDGGSYTVTVVAGNATGTSTQSFTLKINEPPTITSPATAAATIGTPFSFTVTAQGFPAPKLSKTGTLPKGLTFTAATGQITGTPKAGSAGTYPLTITATNAAGTTTRNLTVTVH